MFLVKPDYITQPHTLGLGEEASKPPFGGSLVGVRVHSPGAPYSWIVFSMGAGGTPIWKPKRFVTNDTKEMYAGETIQDLQDEHGSTPSTNLQTVG